MLLANQDGKRVLAQCKNDSEPWKRERLMKLVGGIPRSREDHLYCFLGAASKVVAKDLIAGW